MNETAASHETFYVCAGICRVNPKTNRCAGCGRPWDEPEEAALIVTPVPAQDPGRQADGGPLDR